MVVCRNVVNIIVDIFSGDFVIKCLLFNFLRLIIYISLYFFNNRLFRKLVFVGV